MRKFNTYTSFRATQLQEDGVVWGWPAHFKYFCYLPLSTFVSLYLRHRGCVDGLAGFSFALFSGLFHAVAYLKFHELELKAKHA
jgi:hypothetical protein